MSYKIVLDSCGELPEHLKSDNRYEIVPLELQVGEERMWDDETFDQKNFLQKVAACPTCPKSACPSPERYMQAFDCAAEDIYVVTLSGNLSGSYNSVRLAAEELKEEYPDRKILVVDSLCASLGEGLFVYKAVQMKEAGASVDEVAAWLEEHKQNFCHVFTVDDLFHLYRGGRVSKAAAIVGTMINLKPLLHVDDEGHLIPLSKVRGRKKSLATLVSMMEERIGSWKDKNDIIFISHGDCIEDAEKLASIIKERFGNDRITISYVGPVIGAHSGPGTLALFFLGEHR